MKFYGLDTILNFGKHKGKSLKEVIQKDPSYVNWCAFNLNYFYISKEVLEEIKSLFPNFSLSEEAQKRLNQKYAIWEAEQEEFYQQQEEEKEWKGYDPRKEIDELYFYAMTDGQYGRYEDWDGDIDFLREQLGLD